LLKIDESQERKNHLQATVGLPLVFEPIRRDDFDVFFLAAYPEQGRQIRPHLRFHDAGGKRVFAMGRIYSGELDPTADQDLNGVHFPSTAWQQSAGQDIPMPELGSLRNGSLGNLYALGVDAWNLIPWLPLLMKDPDLAYPGAVGSLQMARTGQLVREPAWTVFHRGRPAPAEWPPQEQ
jgi:outer membrane PBP1 activator LpoA protein